MSKVSNLDVSLREQSGKGASRALRRAGQIPAVLYGNKQTPVSLSISPRVLGPELHKAGFYTRLFNLKYDGGSALALVRDVQFHPVTEVPQHVDFLRVTPDSKVHVWVPVHFSNQDKSPGLKRGGVLNVVLHELEIVVAADNIPEELVVDLDGKDVGTILHLDAVKLPEGVAHVNHEAGLTIATIAAPTVAASSDASA